MGDAGFEGEPGAAGFLAGVLLLSLLVGAELVAVRFDACAGQGDGIRAEVQLEQTRVAQLG